ncbi:MAG: GGDEF domain-containing protein [Candidatus Omnitrophica bacterium]|nr:GGDEF domain-containing protein [Candidatus Omnitrophota bacterium]
MKIDVLKYLQLRLAPTLYRRAANSRAGGVGKVPSPLVNIPDPEVAIMVKNPVLDNFDRKYTPVRLILLLTLTILVCGLILDFLFVWFPSLQMRDMPLIGSVLLIVCLSPVLYAFFYTPMIRQFESLKKAEAIMRELALIDELTGLYNRRGFLTYANHLLKLSLRTKKGLILIYADLDNMKEINDALGHEEGDRALVAIAEVLRKTFRESDVISRVGGDEFAVLALEARAEDLNALSKRLSENMRRSRYNVDLGHKLTFSVGIMYYDPASPQTIEELLRGADVLMYKKKSAV